MDRADRIKRIFVAPPDHYRERLRAPFGGEMWGRKWLCGSDGRAACGIIDESPPDDAPGIAGVLPREWTPIARSTMGALREWAGEVKREPCDVCFGSGTISECACPNCMGHECHNCDGEGDCEVARLAEILATVIDRNLLAKTLACAPDAGLVEMMNGGEKHPVIFRCGDWFAVVAAVIGSSAADGRAAKARFEVQP